MAIFKGIGNSDNFMDTLSNLEKEIKARQKDERDRRNLIPTDDKRVENILNKLYTLVGKNNNEVTKHIKFLVDHDKITSDNALQWIEKIQESVISKNEWSEIKNIWLEDAERNKENDKEKKKELSLWNVLRAGIRGLIPDDTGKKAREVWNTGLKLLGVKFFKDLSKNFTKYIAEGLKFFGMASLWTLLIFGILALFDPNGTFINTIIGGIQAILPIVVNMITKVIQRLPEILATATFLFKRVFTELMPVLLQSLKVIIDVLIKAVPEILLTIGKSMDEILSIVFGKQIKVFEPLMKLVGDIFVMLVNALKDLIPVMIDILKEIIPPILTVLGEIFPIVSEILKILLPTVVYLLKEVLLPIIKIAFTILEPLLDFIKNTLSLVKGILTLDKDVILNSLKGMFDAYVKYLIISTKALFYDLPKLIFDKILKGPTSLLGKYAKNLYEKVLPKSLQKSISSLTDKLQPATEKFKGFFSDLKSDPSGTIKKVFKLIGDSFSNLSKWWKEKGPMAMIYKFFDTLKLGFFNLIYTIGGFFNYVKNRGFTGVISDVATGKIGQQISASTAQIAIGEKIDLSSIAKMDANTKLTGEEINVVKGQLTKEQQKEFDKKLVGARKDNKVTPEEVLDIVKQIGIQQKLQQDKLGKVQDDIYSGKTVFEF